MHVRRQMSAPSAERGSTRVRVLLLTPPFVQLNTPYPATPQLAGFLRERGFDVAQRDLSIETALEVLRRHGDELVDELIELLQGPLPAEAKHAAALHLDAVAERIRTEVDPDFGFSRYAEKLGACVPDFGVLLRRLRRRSPVDRVLEELTERALRETGMLDGSGRRVVGVTCPFPGTLLGALRIARTVRRLLPRAELVLGGGYVNTELRHLSEPRVRRFFDHLMYDEGYAPWMELLSGAAPERVPCFVKPDYAGLDFTQYIDMPESENPMHRLWSTGRWLKVQLARGCYWHRCAFCDVTLDYIRRFEMPSAAEIVDALERLASENPAARVDGVPGFHFTDEAVPPVLARAVSREILRRKFACRWWGNVRFDAAYAGDLPRLMARAGCIAVTGGLECASDRLLALMEKGITLASARRALESFRDAGVMVHAYLMYAFPTQTEDEARAALRFVRARFADGSLQSAYFHRFALTIHSPIAADPARFGIRVPEGIPPAKGLFACNEIPYAEPGAPDWTRIGRALRLALYNFMQGRGLRKSIDFWFDAARSRRRDGSDRRQGGSKE